MELSLKSDALVPVDGTTSVATQDELIHAFLDSLIKPAIEEIERKKNAAPRTEIEFERVGSFVQLITDRRFPFDVSSDEIEFELQDSILKYEEEACIVQSEVRKKSVELQKRSSIFSRLKLKRKSSAEVEKRNLDPRRSHILEPILGADKVSTYNTKNFKFKMRRFINLILCR